MNELKKVLVDDTEFKEVVANTRRQVEVEIDEIPEVGESVVLMELDGNGIEPTGSCVTIDVAEIVKTSKSKKADNTHQISFTDWR